MDVYCPVCTEPLDISCFHDEADEQGISFNEALRAFQSRGCESLTVYGFGPCEKVDSLRGDAMSALFDLLGDDVDGAAAMMEDFEYMGMFD